MTINFSRERTVNNLHKPVLIVIKIVVTLTFACWVAAKIDYTALAETFSVLNPLLFVSAVGLHILAFIFGGLRWWVLLRHTHDWVPFRKVLPSYYLGLFFNIFLPTGVGGDVVRTIHLNLRGLHMKDLIVSALIDRIIGLTVVLLVGISSIVFSPEVNLDSNIKIILALSIPTIAVSGLLLTCRALSR